MKKNVIVCEEIERPVMKRAVEILSSHLLDYAGEYPVCLKYENAESKEDVRKIYIGTKKCGYIKDYEVSIPQKDEAYFIKVENDTVIIGGYDERGVLCGCVDFYNKYIVKYEHPGDDRYVINIFEDKLADFEYSSYPAVKNRGLWTWGHVVYDFKGYIDNLARLKMNTLVIWNDSVPIGAKEITDYAHSFGIKVIWGYAWGWDTDCKKVFGEKSENISKMIFEKYEKEYAMLGGDGIYFQSYTEVQTQEINGRNIAKEVATLVNETAALFYEKYPEIQLQFGLHATSVDENLEFIKTVNPKIRIVWENCGAFPFSYIPSDVEKFDKTREFIEKAAVLRGTNDKFGVVTKGLTKLDWTVFEHLDGAVCAGVCSKKMKQNRIERKAKIWKYLQAYWLVNADKAQEAVRIMADLKQGDLYITPLVEDGMFEENIMFPVALFSEMLWDTKTPVKEMISAVALREYVEFA